MTLYIVLRYVHVLLAIVAVGTNLTYGFWIARAGRDRRRLTFALRTIKFLDDRLANPAYGLLLLTGLAMVFVGKVRWTTPWIVTSVGLYIVVVLVGILVFTPQLRRQIAIVEGRGPDNPEYERLARRARIFGLGVMVVVLLIVLMMVTRPRLWG